MDLNREGRVARALYHLGNAMGCLHSLVQNSDEPLRKDFSDLTNQINGVAYELMGILKVSEIKEKTDEKSKNTSLGKK